MTQEVREHVSKVLAEAYEQMCWETSTKMCISVKARRRIAEGLLDASMADERTTLSRLCALLYERFDDPRRFHIVRDLDLLDAAKDLVTFGASQGDWKITREMELVFA